MVSAYQLRGFICRLWCHTETRQGKRES